MKRQASQDVLHMETATASSAGTAILFAAGTSALFAWKKEAKAPILPLMARIEKVARTPGARLRDPLEPWTKRRKPNSLDKQIADICRAHRQSLATSL